MKSPWSYTPLGEAGEWLSGGTPSKQEPGLWSGHIPWISPKDMKVTRIADSIDHVAEAAISNGTRLVPANTLLMVVRGMILAHAFPVALTTAQVTFNQDIKALCPSSHFDPEFLLYVLQSRASGILRHVDVANHGTKRLPMERLQAVEIPKPPLGEQRKIAAILSAVDETIEKTEAVIEQLQVVKKAMMQELLTRGLPGRHTRFQQTELGEIPADWKVLPLAAVISYGPKNGISPQSKAVPPGVPTFSIAAIRDGNIDLVGNLKYADAEPKEVLDFVLEINDVLIVRGNGNPALMGRSGEVTHIPLSGCIYPDLLMRVRANEKLVPGYLVKAWNSDLVHKQLLLKAKTTNGIHKINQNDVASTLIPVPSTDEQEAIVDTFNAIDRCSAATKNELDRHETLKQALMSVLLTGQVRVTPDEDAP